MILSLSNPLLYQKPLLNSRSVPTFSMSLSYRNSVGLFQCCLRDGNRFPLLLSRSYSERQVSTMENDGGVWEDSDYEDEDEDEEMTDDELDYPSELQGSGHGKAIVTHSNSEELSMRNYEDDLVREVEQMLGPEEREILRQNEVPNLEKLSTGKWKPLHSYALAGQIKFMDELLDKECDINLPDKDGLTALHYSVIGKREAVTSHLLRRGANPEAKDLDGATPLHYAVQVSAMQTVKLLMKYKVDVNAADNEGWTPLHVAIQTRNRDIAKILVVNGADKTRRNQDGNTALDLSLCYGRDFKSYNLAMMLKQVQTSGGYL